MRYLFVFFFFILSFLFPSIAVLGQDSVNVKRGNNFISICIGGSFATGKYSASKSNEEGSGFATSGFLYQFEGAFFWTRTTGIGFTYGGFSNGINQNSFKNDLISNTSVPVGSTMAVSKVESWKTQYIMAGPYITLPFKDMMIDFKAMGGLMFTRSPEFSYSITNSNIATVTTPNIQAMSNSSFGYLLGTNLRLNLSRTTQLKFSLDYLQANVDSGYTINTYYPGNNWTQSITVLNLSWGLAFRVGQ